MNVGLLLLQKSCFGQEVFKVSVYKSFGRTSIFACSIRTIFCESSLSEGHLSSHSTRKLGDFILRLTGFPSFSSNTKLDLSSQDPLLTLIRLGC